MLCFLPGWEEIKGLITLLERGGGSRNGMTLLPLHSTLAADEQQRVFEPAPRGTVKVIVATNIAELAQHGTVTS